MQTDVTTWPLACLARTCRAVPMQAPSAFLYGSGSGLGASGSATFSQSGSVKGVPESNDRFGSSLAAGDFNGDGRDDLAVGVPGEDVGSKVEAGSVNVLYSGPNGLRKSGNRSWTQKGAVNGAVERGDGFGTALAAGDFDGNGKDDLAIGVPGEDIGSKTDAGSVNVLYGRGSGLSSAGDYSFSQKGKIEGAVERHDLLGSSVHIVDLDGDGFDDPGRQRSRAKTSGQSSTPAVPTSCMGSATGLSGRSNEALGQNGAVAGSAEAGDGLGLPTYESWLDRVNLYRTQAGLNPVSERASLSSDAERHSQYMVRNGTVTHSESPGSPGYSSEGNASGGRSNVYGTTLASTSDLSAVDGWVTGPFHAVGFLTPSLVEVGYGAHRDPDADYIRMAASLDIYGAPRQWGNAADGPYTWPGDGSVVPVRTHINEWPSPTTHCSGHNGLPVLAFFEADVNVQAHSFTAQR